MWKLVTPRLVWTAIVCLAITAGHLEDYCVYQTTDGGLDNFFHAAAEHDCKYESYRPECVIAVAKVSAHTFAYSSPCRGAVHFDAVYAVAAALGMVPELAYWLAAYSQGIDFIQFAAVDSCGQPMPSSMWTPPLRGLMRTSAPTGGSARHLGLAYGSSSTNGLKPNLTDYSAEGQLAGYRAWALGETELLCTNGITVPNGDGIPFGGDQCAYSTQYEIPTASFAVQGPIPADYVPYPLGEQVINYDCLDNPGCNNSAGPLIPTNQTYAHELEEYLQQSEFGRLKDGSAAPTAIAKMGTYMHMLADRASHYWCTNSAKTGVVPMEGQPGNFTGLLDKVACNFIKHAMEHYWEQGVHNSSDKPSLAPQSWAAINLYYDELEAWKATAGGAPFFNSSFESIPRQVLIGDTASPGTLASAIMEREVAERVGGLNRVLVTHGLAPIPGFETDCAGQPWQ